MVKFERNGSQIKVIIDTGRGHTLPLTWECGNELYAKLLYSELVSKQYNDTEAFAKVNYEAGWKDKASHRAPKREWHPSNIEWRGK